jgi:hypothetical protein
MKFAPAKKAPRPKVSESTLKEAAAELQRIRAEAAALREQELAIREFLADKLHDGEEGSKTITVGEVKLTITRKLNRSITREDAERLCQEHPDLSVEILSWRPEVKTSGYRANQEVADQFITTKPGPPEVVFK